MQCVTIVFEVARVALDARESNLRKQTGMVDKTSGGPEVRIDRKEHLILQNNQGSE